MLALILQKMEVIRKATGNPHFLTVLPLFGHGISLFIRHPEREAFDNIVVKILRQSHFLTFSIML